MSIKNQIMQEKLAQYRFEHRNDVITTQQILNELNWYMVTQLTDLLFEVGYISFEEYDRLTILNRETFSPMFAALLPSSRECVKKCGVKNIGQN